MKIKYQDLETILWCAKRIIDSDIKKYGKESDKELSRKITEITEYINKDNTMEFLLVEMPF